MASEPYRKVGRGGAGNYYSSQDVEEAAKRINEDVEAQAATHETPIENPEAKAFGYAHSGRGGAGNYKPTANSTALGITNDLDTSVKQPVIPEGRHGGRGGAGNYRGSVSERRQSDAEREINAQQEAYAKTVKDVEKGMKPPEKAHLGNEKLEDP